MRSIKDTAKYFRENDPNTEITEFTLRKMISEGTIPAIKTGNKYLLNLDVILGLFGSDQVNSDMING
jgi:hypothetical protein